MPYKLFQQTSLAFALIALSGDVEPNPSFKCLDDIEKARGLKIAHLNIRSLRNKIAVNTRRRVRSVSSWMKSSKSLYVYSRGP
jgi:hypothetical protein